MPLEPIPIEVAETAAGSIGSADFQVRLEVFAGPLDLLLRLIESRQLDVLTVPLADLADAYVAHLAVHPLDPGQLADFVAVAAQLILLKSRRLLPAEPLTVAMAGEDEPDEDELRRRLVEYRALRDVARQLGERDLTAPVYRREPRDSDLPVAPLTPLPASLLRDVLELLAAIPEPESASPEVVPRQITIAMQIAALRAAMGSAGKVVLQQVLADCRSRTQVTVTFLALLELVRRREARVEQHELFGPILVEAVPGKPAR
jgi:segregation and condensation protein A